jgi:hypothetical protein
MECLPNLRPIIGHILDPRLELPEDMDLVILVMMPETCAHIVDWHRVLVSLKRQMCRR